MHELAIAESVIETITGPDRRPSGAPVRLEVGALSGVSAGSLRFCFELATDGTPVNGAQLDIEEPPGRAHCLTCDEEFVLPT